MRNDPLYTIEKLVKERFGSAKAVFWAGSISQNQGTKSSDLDLIIVFESLPYAYREAFIYEGWPIDAFIHDPSTLRYFFEESKSGNGISGLMEMIINGREILDQNTCSQCVFEMAQQYKKEGPIRWSQNQIDKERFLITDVLEDIKFPRNKDEQVASVAHLFEPLIQFYFRANQKWTASGKALMRLLKDEDPNLAGEFNQAFENFYKTGDAFDIENVVLKILAPYGGLLWDGFRSDALPEWKVRLDIKSH